MEHLVRLTICQIKYQIYCGSYALTVFTYGCDSVDHLYGAVGHGGGGSVAAQLRHLICRPVRHIEHHQLLRVAAAGQKTFARHALPQTTQAIEYFKYCLLKIKINVLIIFYFI